MEMLSTADVARLAGVGTTTIKRWAEQGLLPHFRTEGGHRRFRSTDVEHFLRQRQAAGVWVDDGIEQRLDTVLVGAAHELDAALLTARARLGAWFKVADDIGPVLTEIGHRWQQGVLSVAEEHRASTALSRSLSRISHSLPQDPTAPVCALACVEGEEHTIGLSLVELTLREADWSVLWFGRSTPTADLEAVVGRGQIAMVAMSASESSSDGDALARIAERIADACARVAAHLVLGGAGPWPESMGFVRLRTFAELSIYARGARR